MRILLVDDGLQQLSYLETQLKRLDSFSISFIDKTQNPVEALKKLKINEYDLLFLDVEMPEMTGFELIEIADTANLPAIIFTTAYSDYAVNAFKVNAIDYLLKPIDLEDLSRAVHKVYQDFKASKKEVASFIENTGGVSYDRIVLTEGSSYQFVKFNEIIRVQGSGSYSSFYLMNGKKITTSKRLNVYWKKLSSKGFMRTHQSHIVNIKHVLEYSKADGGFLSLTEGHEVPISNSQKEEVRQQLGLA